jgi:hypothetical protein
VNCTTLRALGEPALESIVSPGVTPQRMAEEFGAVLAKLDGPEGGIAEEGAEIDRQLSEGQFIDIDWDGIEEWDVDGEALTDEQSIIEDLQSPEAVAAVLLADVLNQVIPQTFQVTPSTVTAAFDTALETCIQQKINGRCANTAPELSDLELGLLTGLAGDKQLAAEVLQSVAGLLEERAQAK